MDTLKRVIKDILYLSKNLRSCSFGRTPTKTPITPETSLPVQAVDTGKIHTLCKVPVHIYYYTSKNTLVYTPAGVHTVYSNRFEGPHHPMCKIEGPHYKDYIINEGGVKWNGEIVIFSTEDLENNNPEIYNDDLLMAVILACFYSLHQRLHFYIHRVEDLDKTINYGHNMAPVYTYNKIKIVLGLFKHAFNRQCAENFMNTFVPMNLQQVMTLFEEIKYFSSDLNPERKQFISDMYHSLMEQKPFRRPRIPVQNIEPELKPKRLF
jgi:hypothetical protein